MRDEEILDLYFARDEKAISETQKKYGRYIAKIAYNVLESYEDSNESVNDTFLFVWNSIPPHRPHDLKTYLAKIVRRVSVDVFRKRSRVKRGSGNYELSLTEIEECLSGTVSPHGEVEAEELGKVIEKFLLTLDETTRNLFIMRYFYFDKISQAAKYCGISEEAAKSRIYRARQALRVHLIKEGFIYES